MNQTVTSVRSREPHSHPASPPITPIGQQWEVRYVRTPGDARAGFGRHQRETGHVASFELSHEPNTRAAVKLTICCDEDGCKQVWVAPMN